jgi:Glycosyl transferase family 2
MDVLDGPRLPTGGLPTVTAIMAAHNYGRFIERSLDSVLEQDYPPGLLDVIVVDDGSTDDTPEILDRYRAAHPDRVTVLRQPNSGNRVAANKAFTLAQGELVAMIDADDAWPLDKIRRQAEMLASNDRLGLVYCDTRVIDADDNVIHESYWDLYDIVPQRGPGAFLEIMSYPGNVALNSTILFRKELGHRFFPMPEQNIFQDWWITGHCALLSEIDHVPGLRSDYRQHGANALLAATGHREILARCKTAEMRRKMLVHGAGDHLTDAQLIDAWQAWEHTGRDAAWTSQTIYLPIASSTEQEREWAAEHATAAHTAMRARDVSGALHAAVRALACDPFNGAYRDQLEDLRWVVESVAAAKVPNVADGAPRFITLAYADELASEPQLLSRYVSVVAEEDPATLAIAAAGLSQDVALSTLMTAAAGAGVQLGELPDVLLITDDSPQAQVALERQANALLSHRDIGRPVPAFRPESFPTLKALVLA